MPRRRKPTAPRPCLWCGFTPKHQRADALWCGPSCKASGRRFLRRFGLLTSEPRARRLLRDRLVRMGPRLRGGR